MLTGFAVRYFSSQSVLANLRYFAKMAKYMTIISFVLIAMLLTGVLVFH